MRSQGLRTDGHVKLSDKQQKNLEQAMARAGFPVPKGMHIDQGGNLNQKNYLGRNVAIAAAIGAGTIATLGATGVISGGVLGGFGLGSSAPVATGGFASVPGAVGATAAPLGVGTVTGAAGTGAATGFGAGAFGATAPIFGAATPAAATGLTTVAAPTLGTAATVPGVVGAASAPLAGAGATAPIISNVTRNGMGLSADNWVDIIGKGGNAGLQFFGGRSANAAADRAADLQAKALSEQTQLEREKEARRQYEWDQAEAAKKRNQQIEEENRLEDLRRLDEREAQGEPARLAREATYRAYMKKYWNIDVAPSVPRTARNIQAGTGAVPTAEQTPTKGKSAVDWSPNPLARLAVPGTGYGSFVSGNGVTPQYTEPVQPQTIEFAQDPRYPVASAARRPRFDEGSNA